MPNHNIVTTYRIESEAEADNELAYAKQKGTSYWGFMGRVNASADDTVLAYIEPKAAQELSR